MRVRERGHAGSQHLARGFELIRGVDLSEPRLPTRGGGLDNVAALDRLTKPRLAPIASRGQRDRDRVSVTLGILD
jgi:hypothetical protein